MAFDFFGRGASFPLSIGPGGGIGESTGARKIEESIRIILGTQYGERVMRPNFGCNLEALAFEPMNAETLALAQHDVADGLARWEKRIDVLEVRVEPDPGAGRLVIHVLYRIKSTQEARDFVYPFYLEAP